MGVYLPVIYDLSCIFFDVVVESVLSKTLTHLLVRHFTVIAEEYDDCFVFEHSFHALVESDK